MKQITIRRRKLKLPAFFPDATYGEIKAVSSKDLMKIPVDGVVVNTYHLLKHNLISKIEKSGGIHKYMKLNKHIISDSGGFQVFSLIHKNPELGSIDNEKVTFMLHDKKIIMTPESCIQIQLKIGSDIIMCLDDCRHAKDYQEESVERTIAWARRCKNEFLRLTEKMKDKPLIFGIVQGGENKELRRKCAEALVSIGFDGYAYGGWPMKDGKLLKGILKYTSNLLPNDRIKYAMGVGKPQDIIECVKIGYNLFDCVIPTRDARHKRLFIFSNGKFKEINVRKKYFRIKGVKKLYNLFKKDRGEAEKFATIYNLKT